MSKTKLLTRECVSETVVSEWIDQKGYKLPCVSINLKVFHITLNLAFGEFDEYKRFIKNQFELEIEHKSAKAMYSSFLDKEKVQWHWMLITENNWMAEDYATITHELHHFVHSSLEEMGVAYGTAGEEVFAYMQGYFMKLIVRAFMILKKAQEKSTPTPKPKKKGARVKSK